jgi:hypothetical protein
VYGQSRYESKFVRSSGVDVRGTTARPVRVGPQARTRTFFWLTKALAEYLTTEWTVKAGSAIEATDWKAARFEA